MISVSYICHLYLITTDPNREERVKGHCDPVMLLMNAPSFLIHATQRNMDD